VSNLKAAPPRKATSAWGRLVGPSASAVENSGTVVFGVLGGALGAHRSRQVGDRRLDRVIATSFGMDLIGGVWTNMTPSCKRWYHRPGQGLRQHLGFAAVHVHPHVLARRHRLGWWYGAVHHVYVVMATLLVHSVQPRRKVIVASLASSVGIALDRSLGSVPGHEWVMPAYYLKLLLGHATPSTHCLQRRKQWPKSQ
jgi:hypothetical protein